MEKELNNSFNKEFCEKLEYHLSGKFEEVEHIDVKRFWCDGIFWLPFVGEEDNETYLSIEAVSKRKYIETTAKLGVSGQESYQMKIILGMKAQEAYKNASKMLHSISNKRLNKWLEIDTEKREVIIKLK